MLSFLVLASVPAVMSAATVDVDSGQAIRVNSNGEFIAKNYPAEALKRGEQGKVGFRLVVEPDGSLGSCEVTQSSGFKSLDTETCELIVRHAKLTPVRDSEGRSVRSVQQGFISWKLPANAAATQMASAAGGRVVDPDKIICKKSKSTGSLISRTKQCMTARQWAEAARIARDQTEKAIGSGYCGRSDGSACTE